MTMMDEAAAETVGQCLAVSHVGKKPGSQRLVLVGDVYQRDPFLLSEERMKTNLFSSALGSAIVAGVSQVKLDTCYRCPDKLIRALSASVTGEEIGAAKTCAQAVLQFTSMLGGSSQLVSG